MATPKWVAGTLYPTGSLVQPLTGGGATSTAITNPGFESGTTDWTLGPSMATDTANPFAGVNALRCTGTAGWNEVVHDESPVNPGQSITATCMYQQGGASTNQNTGMVFLRWYTAAMALISDSDGNLIVATEGDHYKQSSVTAVAPSGAAFVSIGGKTNRTNSPDSRFDNFAWNYAAAVAPPGLIFKAVQPTLGTSAATEPAWPASVGLTVVDNTVIWEALVATRVTYEASPILVSGAVEPSWPESIGDFVADGTISWEAVPQQVIQAPQSKVVTIASSKVYAANGDIVRYCATVNPLDWTSADDAGYLPTGLNQYGSNRTAVLNTYRGNVVPFSASTFLCYQADPDPANITQLDAMEGIGSTYQQAAHPVANDLFYLSPLGVRTVGIAAGTSNLAAGDAGAPIDPLVQAALVPTGVRPMAAYYPNQGQYWLCMRAPLPVVEGPTITGSGPDGQSGQAYAQFNYTITPGDSPVNNVIVSGGDFPDGLIFNEAGYIEAGIPGAGGSYTFDLLVTDNNGISGGHTDTIVISPAQYLTGGGFSGVTYTSAPYDWTVQVSTTGNNSESLVESRNGKVFAFYNNKSGASVSTDAGATWTACTGLPTSTEIVALVYSAGNYIAIPDNTTDIYVSTDGISFSARAYAPSAARTDSAIAIGDVVIVGRGNSAQGRRSIDGGVTWADMPLVSSTQVWAFATNGSSICAVTAGVVPSIRRSIDDGASWSTIGSPIGQNLASIAYGNGVYLLVNSAGDVATSPDGVTWTVKASIPESMGSIGQGNEMVFDGVLFVIACTAHLFTSQDGTEWTQRNNLAAAAIAFYRSGQ